MDFPYPRVFRESHESDRRRRTPVKATDCSRDDLLSMTDQIWDALWTNRIFYTRGGVYAPFEADTRDAIVHIVCGYLGLLHWRNKRVDLNATKASRVAFLCWYHTPPEEHARDNLTVFMTFTSNATAPELGVFIEDIVCEVLGAEAILFRFKRELEQPSLVDMSLVVCMRIFQLLRKHPSVDNLIGPHALFRNAAVALKRQREKGGKSTLGRQCEWYAIAWSASLLWVSDLLTDRFSRLMSSRT
ncbi:hypothetical protein OF83DRAFT_438617 [Amylostereum chailletii]|nr:hypothetical protein OF83DRAFT_438617 [Amylostereum chailletii]